MNENSVMLKMDKATARFNGGAVVVGPFSLELHGGQRVAITGPSGCGKTTLLRMAAGLVRPASGTVALAPQAHNHIGYVFQEPRLLPWRTVAQNVALPLIAAGGGGVARDEATKRAHQWLELVGLADSADAWPLALSGGMAQRVNFARAMAMRPRVLLLDEPFSSLAAEAREHMLALVAEHTTNAAILLVTHHPEEIADFVTGTLNISGQ